MAEQNNVRIYFEISDLENVQFEGNTLSLTNVVNINYDHQTKHVSPTIPSSKGSLSTGTNIRESNKGILSIYL